MSQKSILSVSLDLSDDADIIRWLSHQQNKSAAVRCAIRETIVTRVTLADIMRAINNLEHRLNAGAAITETPTPRLNGEEPPEAARNLDGLLDRLEDW